MTEASPRLIRLEEEIKGDHGCTADFLFCRLGESVPLKPSDSQFDLQAPPSRPLAISERYRAIFLAHSEGFMVAKTEEVIGLGKEIKEKGNGPCIQNSCVVDVNIGRVYLLALSNDSSVLAAAVGGEINFFYVPSLLNDKEHKPSFSCSLRNSRKVKDLRWQKNSQKSFILLLTDGLLCHGRIKDPLKDVMENVDAVDWSLEGDFIAVARKSNLSIFSYDFKEQICISLLFQSWSTDDESESSIKVDSIEWVRDDSIVVGCVRVNEDGAEDGYLVQVITSGEKKFTEISCKPVVFSFPDVFEGALDDILPTGAGPYLLMSYLDRWELLLASNKKNIDQHILLLKYSIDGSQKEVSLLEFQNDKYRPSIPLQENGDDNLILAFGIDKVSLYEKVRVQVGVESKELSPLCVLFCLTCEGKLIMYHVARISDPSDLPQPSLPPTDVSLEDDILATNITSEVSSVPISSKLRSARSKDIHEAPRDDVQYSKGDESHDNSIVKPSIGKIPDKAQLLTDLSQKNGPGYVNDRKSVIAETVSSIGESVNVPFFASNVLSEAALTRQENATNILKDSNVSEVIHSSSKIQGAVSSLPSHGFFRSDGSNAISSPFSSGAVISGFGDKSVVGLGRTSFSTQKPISSNLLSGSQSFNLKGSSGGQPASSFSGSFPFQESPVVGKSSFSKPQSVMNSRTSKSSQMLDSEPELSKQFYIVKDMIKELDNLLALIEQEGGFRDACIVYQQSSLSTLEEGLKDLSEISKLCMRNVDEELLEIQELKRKMLQVSAKQVYMKDIVKQAFNNQYWDIWNKQKLSPEIEQKKQHIWKSYQDLTNQLIELERYFNNLEISKFGRNDTVSAGRRALHGNLNQSRHIQSLHSVHNTLNSQLAAAEKLSECLSKQMCLLNINNSSTKRTGVAKELFESIGLGDEDVTLKSPFVKNPFSTPDSIKRISASAHIASKEHPKKALTSALSSAETETMRRRRESLGRSWASFEPPKTIVKRITQQEHVKVNADNPFRMAKKQFDSQIEKFTINQQKDTGPSTSLTELLNSKVQPEAHKTASKDIQEKAFQHISKSPASPVFKWAKEPSGTPQILVPKSPVTEEIKRNTTQASFKLPQMSSQFLPGLAQTSESKSHYVEELQKNSTSTSFPVTPSPSLFNSDSKERKASTLNISSTMKSVSPPKTIPNLQIEVPNSMVTSSKFASSTSYPKSTSTDAKAQGNKQQHVKPFGEGFTWKFQGSTAASPQSSSSLSTKTDALLFSKSTAPSDLTEQTDQTVTVTCKEQVIKTVSAVTSHSKKVISQPPFSTSELLTPSSMSAVSAMRLPSLPTMASGRSSPLHANDIQATNLQVSVSALTSTFSQNSIPSSSSSSSQSQPLSSTSGPTSTGSPVLPISLPNLNDIQSESEPTSQLASSHDQCTSKVEPAMSQATANLGSTGLRMTKEPSSLSKVEPAMSQATGNLGLTGLSMTKEPSSLSTGDSIISSSSTSQPEIKSAAAPLAGTIATQNNDVLDINSSKEEEMEEEVSDVNNVLNLGALGGFGLGSASTASAPKPNPFGGSFISANTSTASSPVTLTAFPGQLFRPPSFNLPTAQPVQPSVSMSSSAFSGGSSGFGGFGQPSQIGAGQQALGTVLGAFGQSRQLGSGGFSGGFSGAAITGGFSSASGFAGTTTGGGFSALASRGGGFAGAATGGFAAVGSNSSGFASPPTGGFSAVASSGGGGFAAVASSGGGGFAAVASSGGAGGFAGAGSGGGFGVMASPGSGFAGAGAGAGFGPIASTGGGFAGAASQGGGGFGGAGIGGGFTAVPGGFGAFSSTQGSAFSAFGGSGSTGSGRPPSELFTQMRR